MEEGMASKQDTWTRRADGRPETVADKRFFDLRESGYVGPVDQDGRKVTSGSAVEVLAAMRRRCR
jgi:hypothetical protein